MFSTPCSFRTIDTFHQATRHPCADHPVLIFSCFQIRDGMMAQFKVQGIPRLVILGNNGSVVCDDARQVPLTPATFASWERGTSGQAQGGGCCKGDKGGCC